MDGTDSERWITVNGTHILIRDGETVEQAIERSFGTERDRLAAMLSYRSDMNNSQNKKSSTEIKLSKQEYGVLRKEVMRKNAAQKGKVRPINFAYTANYFYIYSTNGGDSFTPIKQLDIEENREAIDDILDILGD